MLKKILIGLGLLIVLAAGLLAWQIGPRNIWGMLRYDQRREGDLKVGDVAPDLVLTTLDGAGEARLLAHGAGRPLVIVFGSFT